MTLKKLGRYELIRVLGKGAMGVVYEARDPNLERRVAIKTVKVENLSEEAAAEYEHRFRTEARSAARLSHPNVVSVYDADRDGDTAFLVMEYIQGDDLKHHLDRGVRYSLEQSMKIIRDLLVRRTRRRARQHDPRPQRQRLRRLGPPRPAQQLRTFPLGQRQLGLRPSRPRHPPILRLQQRINGARH